MQLFYFVRDETGRVNGTEHGSVGEQAQTVSEGSCTPGSPLDLEREKMTQREGQRFHVKTLALRMSFFVTNACKC